MFGARIKVTTAITEELDPVSAAPLVVHRVLELVNQTAAKPTVSVVLKTSKTADDKPPGSGGDKPPPSPAPDKPTVVVNLTRGEQDGTSILNDMDLTQKKTTVILLFFEKNFFFLL